MLLVVLDVTRPIDNVGRGQHLQHSQHKFLRRRGVDTVCLPNDEQDGLLIMRKGLIKLANGDGRL
jgi:hypothetical protein